MKITIDMDTNEVVVPKTFFEHYKRINKAKAKLDCTEETDPFQEVLKAVMTAVSNPAKYFSIRK